MKAYSFLVITICFLAACEKDKNVNKTSNSNIPSTITYQLEDTSITTGIFNTYLTVDLFPDADSIYFDSIAIRPISAFLPTLERLVYKMDFSRFADKKYLIVKTNFTTNSDSVPSVIHFNNDNQISELNDEYNLNTEEAWEAGGWWINLLQYQNFSSSTPIWSSLSVDGISSIADQSYNFDVLDANNDSMKVASGKRHDALGFDRIYKYTVYFDTHVNNTSISAICGYHGFDFDDYSYFYPVSLGNRGCNLYQWFKFIPLPKSNTKLAKSIYLTEYIGSPMYNKIADYTYEFDSQNRVTKATIDYSYTGTDLYWDYLLNHKPSIRILFNY